MIFAFSGSSPKFFRLRASSEVYLRMTSPLPSWKSRRERRMMSPWLIQTFLRIFPRICGWTWLAYLCIEMEERMLLFSAGETRRTLASRLLPSKHMASSRPLPSILTTWAYSWPSSLKVSSRRWSSFSLVPRLRFLPPYICAKKSKC